jgi:transposase-like protein
MSEKRAAARPKEERKKIVEAYMQSGMSMAAYSRENELNHYTLHNWIEKYKRETPTENQNREWMEIQIPTKIEGTTFESQKPGIKVQNTPIRITLGAAVIEVAAGFDEMALTAILRAVKCQC